MPCSCQNTLPNYPVTDNWGPSLWSILHALAERGGKVITPRFRDDEKRQWIQLIEIMPKMIPCPDCRAHATEWIQRNPITAIKDIPSDEIYMWITTWVYRFHEDVNTRIGKPSFDKALLAETYSSIDIIHIFNSMKPFIVNAIRLSGVTIIPWQKWISYFTMLRSLYGI
jgi:hypothetical protein